MMTWITRRKGKKDHRAVEEDEENCKWGKKVQGQDLPNFAVRVLYFDVELGPVQVRVGGRILEHLYSNDTVNSEYRNN
jgi:hypothetical protein